MKKILIALCLILGFSFQSEAQSISEHALGLRFGGNNGYGASTHLAPLVIGVRYDQGLQNIVDNDFANFSGIEARNSNFQVYVAFEF
jgi:hypothetical protein